jgi:S-adenosylmethionine/arginine decarboxylase-like enzyme
MKVWGYHLMLDCSGCNLDYINSKPHIEQFLKELVDRIDMISHGDPQIEFLLPGTDNEGYSVLQMITTSNITAHFVNSSKTAYIDVFSCKFFEKDIAVKVVQDYFSPMMVKVNFLERQA